MLGLAVVTSIAVMLATRHGPGLGNDSIDYLVGARNLIGGRGYLDFEGQATTNWPPAYPLAIASGDLVGFGSVLSARLVNAVAMGATVVLAYVLLRRHARSQALVLGGLLVVACSPALLRAADYVKSEPLFCALVLGFVVVIEDVGRKPDRRAALVLAAAAISWAAFLTRYAGMWLVVTGVLVLVLEGRRSKSWWVAVRSALPFGILASLVPLLWFVRNALAGSESLGVRIPSALGPVALADRVLSSVGYWFLPEPIPRVGGTLSRAAAITLGMAVIAMVIAAVVVIGRNRTGAWTAPRLMPMALVILVVTYFGFVLVSNLRAGSSINSRMMTPIVVPVIVLAAWLVDHIVSGSPETRRVLLTRVVGVVVVLIVMTEAVLFVSLVYIHGRAGRGYAAATSVDSELVRESRDIDADAVIFSNDPWAVAYGTRHEPVILAPKLLESGMSHRPASARDLAAAACRGDAFLAWFFASPEARNDHGNQVSRDPPPPYAPEGSTTPIVRLRSIARVADGTLYRIETRRRGGCAQAQ